VRKNLSPVNNIFGYLLKAYRQQLFLDLKKQNKYVNMDIIPENDFDYFRSHEKLIIEKEELSIIKSALKTSLNALPPRLKEIIYFRFDLGLSYEDISAILNISVESCHKTTYRAVKAMRGEIKKSQHFSQIKFLVSRLSGLSEQ
jgi:RNA polymerase sigma factor (sigma-70 family)